MKMVKKGIIYTLIFLLIMAVMLPATALGCEEEEQAQEKEKPTANSTGFTDVSTNHWAFAAIVKMAERGIMGGYPDGKFRPEQVVTRAEFAKMMVYALNLPRIKPAAPTFKDIPKNHWAYEPVETAKHYLTGFRSAQGDYFRPQNEAVREDMAVALVKAMGYGDADVDDAVLTVFLDREQISPNLKKFVKIAISNNIMGGYPVEGTESKVFKPQDPLTRAEAASLLCKILNDKEEKITYGENIKVDYPLSSVVSEYTAPVIQGQISGNRIKLLWNAINDSRLQGYKVVISKDNSNPKYPEDGYLYYITDKNRTYAYVDNKEPYKNGDFGQYLTSGQQYYFSITAVYKEGKVPGNVVLLTMP